MGSANADWANVIVALIVGLPGIISAIYAARIHHKVKTPSGTSIGSQVENALHTGLANNYRLRSIGDKVDAPHSDAAQTESEKVSNMPEGAAGYVAPAAPAAPAAPETPPDVPAGTVPT